MHSKAAQANRAGHHISGRSLGNPFGTKPHFCGTSRQKTGTGQATSQPLFSARSEQSEHGRWRKSFLDRQIPTEHYSVRVIAGWLLFGYPCQIDGR
jgi:hypothetical protein